MEYKILIGDFQVMDKGGGLDDFLSPIEMLEVQVNEAIKEGWSPLGGVAVYVDSGNQMPVYNQAMIRED